MALEKLRERGRLLTSAAKYPFLVAWASRWIFFECFSEVAIVVFFGVFPFWLSVLRYNATADKVSLDIGTVFVDSFSGGQLFLYAFSMLGTLLWLGFFNWTVPYRLHRILLALVVIVIGFLIVAIGGIDPSFSRINNKAIVDLSFYCYGALIIIYFLLLLGTKERPPSVRETINAEVGVVIHRLRELGSAE